MKAVEEALEVTDKAKAIEALVTEAATDDMGPAAIRKKERKVN